MLGVSGLLGNSGDGEAPDNNSGSNGGEAGMAGSNTGGGGGGGGGGMSEEDRSRLEEGDMSSGGNRWPRQETLALLKIRSDMDGAFRESSLKGPLWEEVSRKLAELGYHRSAKKCKEKFENVYKYHKRTKEGRASKPDGKTYRFFDQLEALDTTHSSSLPLLLPSPKPQPQPPMAVAAAATTMTTTPTTLSMPPITIPSTANPISTVPQFAVLTPTIGVVSSTSTPLPPQQSNLGTTAPMATNVSTVSGAAVPSSHQPVNLTFNSPSSSSTSSDEEPERRGKRKRKWEYFFQRLMKEVIDKQEEMQKNFLDALEKRERDRMAREEAWRVQEMARMNREHDRLVQERSMAAAKDAAVIAFLQKIADQQNPNPNPNANAPQMQMQIQLPSPSPSPAPVAVTVQENSLLPQQPALQSQSQLQLPQQPQLPLVQATPAPPPPAPVVVAAKNIENPRRDNGGESLVGASSSRWPKAEVQALIKLRTDLDLKYQENGPKGPLWEEISSAMQRLGYNRNAKRCKEKWENINKYFKKVKESNKKRPEDAKTCPYFHQLDALYREKNNKGEIGGGGSGSSFNPVTGFGVKPDQNPMVPIMVRPEQQWPVPQEDHESGNNQNQEDDDEGDEEEEEDDEGGGYELVANKPPSNSVAE